MNILFIGKRFNTNRDALIEKFGRNYQLPLHLTKINNNVELWLVDYHYNQTIYSKDENLNIISTPIKNLSLFRHWFSGKYKYKENIDFVIASGDCYIGLLGSLVAKSIKAKFVFDVYDKYDEFGGYIKPFGFDLFGYLLHKADIRFFASQLLMNKLGNKNKDCILLNGIDADHFKDIEKNLARKKVNIQTDQYLIGYFGGMESDRGIKDLITAVELLRKENVPIELVLGGKAPDYLDLNQQGIRYLGNIPFKDIPYALASCDILAIPYRRSPFMDAGASNKIAEYIACKRPIVATKSPNFSQNFPLQAQILAPYLAEPSNPLSLANAIKKQLNDRIIVNKSDGIYWNQIAEHIQLHLQGQIDG